MPAFQAWLNSVNNILFFIVYIRTPGINFYQPTLFVLQPNQRILSIDAFRGITIFVMVFVNDLAGTPGIPAWMGHMPANADAMSFVDVVFPAFLFIAGMSVPLIV